MRHSVGSSFALWRVCGLMFTSLRWIRGRSIAIRVAACLSVCLSVCLRNLVLCWQQCNSLCYVLSGFVDDVMFSHSGANGPQSSTTLCDCRFCELAAQGAKLLFTFAGLFVIIAFFVYSLLCFTCFPGLPPGPLLLSFSVFVFILFLFFSFLCRALD